MQMSHDFEGKSGILTGGASGIGRAVAFCLAARGAKVLVADIDREGAGAVVDAISATGGTSIAVEVDVADESSVVAMVKEAIRKFGVIDFLINNAGIIRKAPFLELESQQWDQLMNVNLRGAFICCRSVMPHMVENGGGAIVNVSSMAGRNSSVFGGAHYTASKAGLLGLTRHLAREMGPKGVRVNSLCPGFVLTPLVSDATELEDFANAASRTPIGRYGTPEEQAEIIAFLLSDASAFITGASIDANGGALML